MVGFQIGNETCVITCTFPSVNRTNDRFKEGNVVQKVRRGACLGRLSRWLVSGSVNQHDLAGRPALIAGIQPHHGPCITTYTLSQKEFIKTQIIIFWEKIMLMLPSQKILDGDILILRYCSIERRHNNLKLISVSFDTA